MEVKELYDFQKRTVWELMHGKHITYARMGSGKNPISMVWAAEKCAEAGKHKVLVITTASKSRSGDHAADFETFVPEEKRRGINIITISWHKLARWVDEHPPNRPDGCDEYVVVADELQRCGAGASSKMGRAFLRLTRANPDWAGFTGTPGDTWLKFYPYFTACGLVKNKTTFLAKYASVQTFKGFPEIVGWKHEDELREMWRQISYAPDTSSVTTQLPKQTHVTVEFARPKDYAKVLKTRLRAGSDGSDDADFLDTAGALTAELRRLCFTKAKQEWVKDFTQDLESGSVFFYNFIKTGDELEEIVKKALPKNAKVWRVDGTHHDVPTAETIGPNDMVLCQWQSGSEALNLQFLHYWVSVEACYSYSTSVQARGRIDRIGQTEPMTFYYLRTRGTIEEDIYKCLRGKGDFSERNWCLDNNIKVKGE